jgi:uncharacterized damage-inducible protein DinB
MNATLDTEFLQMVSSRMLDEYPRQIRACLDVLGDEGIWWRPNEQSNAAGNLVLHLAGSNQFYLGHAIGGAPDVRHREAEFGARGGQTADAVMRVHEEARATVDRVLATLTPERLTETTDAPGRTTSFARVLLHVTHHNALHIGQIVWIAKSVRPGALNELLRAPSVR